MNTTPRNASATIGNEIAEIVEHIGQQAESRAYRASNELTNATAFVLRGQRSGKVYRVPGTGSVKYNKRTNTATVTYKKYTASAPGEPPAVRTGVFRAGWKRRSYSERLSGADRIIHAVTENDQKVNNYLLGELLEYGTNRMQPRPYTEKVKAMALPKIVRIYSEPYER